MPGGSRSRSRSADREYSSSSRRRHSRSPSRRSGDRKESRYSSSSRHRDSDYNDSDRTRDRDRDERGSSQRDREDGSRRRDDRDSRESSSRRDRDRDRSRDRSRERTTSSSNRDGDRDRDRERDSGRSSSSRHRRRHSDSESGSDQDGEKSDSGRRGRSSKKSSSSSSRKKAKRETSEERALRKAARKKEKEELNKTVEMAIANYSNTDNPFNDANLGQKFVWAKKREVEKKKGISKSESARRDAERREEAMKELEKLNRKRIEREREREEREEELQRIQRMSEQAQLGDWQAKEDEFHLEQAKRRAEIRIKNSRAKPIDILAINVKMISDDKTPEEMDEEDEEEDLGFEIEVEEPYTIFENLSLEEVEELHQDIKFYLSLDKHESSKEFWRAMLIVCDDKLAELKRRPDEKSVVAPTIIENITRMLEGKSLEQLQLLQGQFRNKLNSGGAIEVEYWETALKILIVWIAKVKLQQMHQMVLEKRLDQLKRRQQREAQKETAQLAAVMAMQTQDVHGDTSLFDQNEAREEDEDESLEDDQAAAAGMVYDRSMSPEPMDHIPQDDASLEVVDADEDWRNVVEQRRKVLLKQFNPKKRVAHQDDEEHPDDAFVAKVMYEKEAAKNVGGPMEVEGDETSTFNADAPLQQQTYMWQDKYRPRKPRFFNRVHTGYEWNKYNQTHYDHDNPPPKIVQGYKFNIFYPDLIDKSKAPTYVIEREPGNTDTVLIRFKAGPPYEDIAFRIVNREWEHSHKRGFKSVFDRGVLQLHFNFKRQFYRR
ncbi:hypothetical protein BGZ73_007867 [Actinomortierella ambigua]|nr:hypothetical protein BGZ73_007867 [Actinomortierella ambigua]